MNSGIYRRLATIAVAALAAAFVMPAGARAQAYASTAPAADALPGSVARYGAVFDQWVASRRTRSW
jgi:hypothetical protein